jgi:hypothetical protein
MKKSPIIDTPYLFYIGFDVACLMAECAVFLCGMDGTLLFLGQGAGVVKFPEWLIPSGTG